MTVGQTLPRRAARAPAQQDCARSSRRSASSSASAPSSRWSPSARAPRRGSRASFAAMGTNLLIVLSGSTHIGRRDGRLRLDAHAHVGRSRRHPHAGAAVRSRRARAPVDRADRRARTPTGRRPSAGRTPEYFDIRNWHDGARLALRRGGRRAGTKVVVLGQTVAEQAVRRQASTPSASTVRIRNVPFLVARRARPQGAVADGHGLRRRRVHPVDHLPDEDPGGPQELHLRHHLRERHQRPTTRRARRARSPHLLRDRHHIAPATTTTSPSAT